VIGGDFQNGEIRVRVLAHDLTNQLRLVGQPHFDFRRVAHDVVIGNDVPVGRDDDAGSGARRVGLRSGINSRPFR
jgi:hypothetical protein